MKKKSNEPEGGQVETDKWPLALARPWGLATVLSVRRRRVSFDGNRQIANHNLQIKVGPICDAFTHQKIPAPAAHRDRTAPVHSSARVQAATCLSQLARPRKAGKSKCIAATALQQWLELPLQFQSFPPKIDQKSMTFNPWNSKISRKIFSLEQITPSGFYGCRRYNTGDCEPGQIR